MKSEQMLQALEAAATQLGVRVRYEALQAGSAAPGGGLCRVKGEWWVIVDKKASAAERAAILTDALSGFDTTQLALPPKVREALALRRAARPAAPPG